MGNHGLLRVTIALKEGGVGSGRVGSTILQLKEQNARLFELQY